jgi:hypothetical protein
LWREVIFRRVNFGRVVASLTYAGVRTPAAFSTALANLTKCVHGGEEGG